MAELVDGNRIARIVQRELTTLLTDNNVRPRLCIFKVEGNSVVDSFVNRKRAFAEAVGIDFVEHLVTAETTTEELAQNVEKSAESCDGIVVQLPLPSHINEQEVRARIPAVCDVDALRPDAGDESGGALSFMPPVAAAVREIIERHHIPLESQRAVVIGKGSLVGAPVAAYLARAGVAELVMIDRETDADTVATALKNATLIVSGAGVPELITPEKISDGVVLIDAGTANANNTVVGDIAHACADKATLFSRTPGGVGPITVAMLFRNLVARVIQNPRR